MASYMVRILTHARRGAGTTASVRLYRILGTEGSCGPSPWLREGFPSGSEVFTRVDTDRNLGVLKEVEIGHDSIGDVGTGWLLSGVGVKLIGGTQEEDWFPCGKWLGESDAQDGESGPARVILKKETKSDVTYPTKHESLSAIQVSGFCIPESSKLKLGKRGKVTKFQGWAGEDVFFIAKDHSLFGVSDGVSQWRESGVDSGLFSRALAEGALSGGTMESAVQRAKEVGVQGSATMTIVRVDLLNAKCSSEILGDSQVALVRNHKTLLRSVEQEHSFGVPFQLSSCDGRDQPKDCLKYEWDLESGDYIVTGTDGLFDNLGDDDIAKIVTKEDEYPTCFAKSAALCQAAFDVSQTTKGDSPYSRAANEALNLAFSGGKKDDITAVVARVT